MVLWGKTTLRPFCGMKPMLLAQCLFYIRFFIPTSPVMCFRCTVTESYNNLSGRASSVKLYRVTTMAPLGENKYGLCKVTANFHTEVK